MMSSLELSESAGRGWRSLVSDPSKQRNRQHPIMDSLHRHARLGALLPQLFFTFIGDHQNILAFFRGLQGLLVPFFGLREFLRLSTRAR